MTKYLPGESGNPNGKKPGTLNKRTQLAKLLEPHAEELIEKAVELARSGDVNALRLCLERLIPKVKDECISFVLPVERLTEIAGLLDSNSSIIQAVAEGEITPEQGQTFSALITSQYKLIVDAELKQRLEAIEQMLKERGCKNE